MERLRQFKPFPCGQILNLSNQALRGRNTVRIVQVNTAKADLSGIDLSTRRGSPSPSERDGPVLRKGRSDDQNIEGEVSVPVSRVVLSDLSVINRLQTDATFEQPEGDRLLKRGSNPFAVLRHAFFDPRRITSGCLDDCSRVGSEFPGNCPSIVERCPCIPARCEA